MQGDRRSGLVVHDHYVVALHWKPKLRRCNVHPKVLGEVGFRPERDAANGRVDAIRSDHQIEPTWCCSVEDHVNAAIIGLQLSDRLIEQDLSISTTSLQQDRAEIRPRYLHLSVLALTGPHACLPSAVFIDKDQLAYLGRCIVKALKNAQSLRYLVRTLANIHWIAARSDTLITFEDGWLVSGPSPQRRERRAGDSRTGNQYG